MLVLNLGCGLNRKRLYEEPFPEGTVHVDHNAAVRPDVVHDLNHGLPAQAYGRWWNQVDEIHAYHLIEHIGVMGDTKAWFEFWKGCWAALKPGGMMFTIAPWFQHEDAVGDPTHSRLICKQTFHFLSRKAYLVKDGERGSAMSKLAIDFDFEVLEHRLVNKPGEFTPCALVTALRAVKTKDGGLVPLETEMEAAKL